MDSFLYQIWLVLATVLSESQNSDGLLYRKARSDQYYMSRYGKNYGSSAPGAGSWDMRGGVNSFHWDSPKDPSRPPCTRCGSTASRDPEYRGNGYDNLSPEWNIRMMELAQKKGWARDPGWGTGKEKWGSQPGGSWTGSIKQVDPAWGGQQQQGPWGGSGGGQWGSMNGGGRWGTTGSGGSGGWGSGGGSSWGSRPSTGGGKWDDSTRITGGVLNWVGAPSGDHHQSHDKGGSGSWGSTGPGWSSGGSGSYPSGWGSSGGNRGGGYASGWSYNKRDPQSWNSNGPPSQWGYSKPRDPISAQWDLMRPGNPSWNQGGGWGQGQGGSGWNQGGTKGWGQPGSGAWGPPSMGSWSRGGGSQWSNPPTAPGWMKGSGSPGWSQGASPTGSGWSQGGSQGGSGWNQGGGSSWSQSPQQGWGQSPAPRPGWGPNQDPAWNQAPTGPGGWSSGSKDQGWGGSQAGGWDRGSSWSQGGQGVSGGWSQRPQGWNQPPTGYGWNQGQPPMDPAWNQGGGSWDQGGHGNGQGPSGPGGHGGSWNRGPHDSSHHGAHDKPETSKWNYGVPTPAPRPSWSYNEPGWTSGAHGGHGYKDDCPPDRDHSHSSHDRDHHHSDHDSSSHGGHDSSRRGGAGGSGGGSGGGYYSDDDRGSYPSSSEYDTRRRPAYNGHSGVGADINYPEPFLRRTNSTAGNHDNDQQTATASTVTSTVKA